MSHQYNWSRYWHKRGERDAATFHSRHFGWLPSQNTLLKLDELHPIPCLILLGEPGMGKSSEIVTYCDYLKAILPENQIRKYDLQEFSTDQRLIDKIFGDSAFKAWKNSGGNLYLILDSLDEGRLRVASIERLLTSQLEELSPDCIKRLFLRIACRTADWPYFFESSLHQFWPTDVLQVFELAPLTRKDITEAAHQRGFDYELFQEEVWRVNADALATKPITLNMLLNLFEQGYGKLPSSQVKLYEQGCELLCDETNPERRGRDTSQFSPEISAKQRLIAASQIAAITVFGNKFAVWREINLGNIPDSDVAESELAQTSNEAKDINTVAIREALSTGLFAAKGAGRMGWAHQTYAEFLAAFFVMHHQMSVPQIMSLITYPQDGQLIEQLYETASWIASMDRDIFREIIKLNPNIALISDVADLNETIRSELAQELLDFNDRDEFSGRNYSYRDCKKLFHPTLAEQLCGYIGNDEKSLNARLLAIEIAEACSLEALVDDLIEIALDFSQPHRIRKVAITSLYESFRTDSRNSRLLPLIDRSCDYSFDPDFKGYVLGCLWPKHISTQQLFDELEISEEGRLVIGGGYSNLLDYTVEVIDVEGLVAALGWIQSQPSLYRVSLAMQRFVSSLMKKSWELIDQPNVLDAFVKAAWARLLRHEPIVFSDPIRTYQRGMDTPDEEFNDALLVQTDKRQQLLRNLVRLTLSENQASLISFSRHPLIIPSDLAWMIQQLQEAELEETRVIWGYLIKWTFENSVDVQSIHTVYDAIQDHSLLKEFLGHHFLYIEFASEIAEEMRRRYSESKWLWESANQVEEIEEYPLLENIQTLLNQCENVDSAAWWYLDTELNENPTRFGALITDDLSTILDLTTVDDATRARILLAAKRYLLEQNPFIGQEDWKEEFDIKRHRPARAGYHALFLLLKQNAFLAELGPEIWRIWMPVLVNHKIANVQNETDAAAWHKKLFSFAYQYASSDLLNELSIAIDSLSAQGRDRQDWFIERFDLCWDHQLEQLLATKVKEHSLSPHNLQMFLHFMFLHESDEFYSLIDSLLNSFSIDDYDEEKVVAIATLLMDKTSNTDWWSSLWKILEVNPHLGQLIVNAGATGDSSYGRHNLAFLSHLPEALIAEFYIKVCEFYPIEDDPIFEGGEVPDRVSIQRWRDSILAHLQSHGTEESILALQKIVDTLPPNENLRYALHRAKILVRRSTWMPTNSITILQLAADNQKRHIESERQLLEVIIESLMRLQEKLQGETPRAKYLWSQHGKDYFPKGELDFSDFIKNHLDDDLGGRSILVAREVEIRRRHGKGGAAGEDTDIHVDVFRRGVGNQPSNRISLIIEVKCCWNERLYLDMESQLANRYLTENDATQCGLYLIGWFNCVQWKSSRNKNRCMSFAPDISELKRRLENQATELSKGLLTIKSFVLDASLR